jgi:hypothetical protein
MIFGINGIPIHVVLAYVSYSSGKCSMRDSSSYGILRRKNIKEAKAKNVALNQLLRTIWVAMDQ